jgi:SAM-dependent methyltransferase
MNSDYSDLVAIRVMSRYYAWKADLVFPYLGSRTLEVGCGTGLLMERLLGRDLVFGVDRDPACVEAARERFKDRKGVRVEMRDAAGDGLEGLAGNGFTSVVFASSLEEFVDDRSAVRNAAGLLKPGGKVVVFAAAMPGIAGELDRSFAARRYRPGELQAVLEGAGLKVAVMKYVNLLGAVGWWWDSRVVRRSAVSEGAYRFRDLAVPLARFLDALTGPPIGRSLLAVGEKT